MSRVITPQCNKRLQLGAFLWLQNLQIELTIVRGGLNKRQKITGQISGIDPYPYTRRTIKKRAEMLGHSFIKRVRIF